MFEGFGWKKNSNEKRVYVNPETGEPTDVIITSDTGEVIGTANSPAEAQQKAQAAEEEHREAI